ncbi:MAG: hypothetical protein ACHRXM_36825 [Isosphaerales bacterium]
MYKFPIAIAHDIRPERRSSKALRTATVVLLGLVLAAPVQEGVSLCIGQWREVMGTSTEVRTPILDSVHDRLQDAHQSVANSISNQFQTVPWAPSLVLTVAAVVVAVGVVILKY